MFIPKYQSSYILRPIHVESRHIKWYIHITACVIHFNTKAIQSQNAISYIWSEHVSCLMIIRCQNLACIMYGTCMLHTKYNGSAVFIWKLCMNWLKGLQRRQMVAVIQGLVHLRPSQEHIEGILPKGPYLPCVSMAGRALLAGYPRHVPDVMSCVINTQSPIWSVIERRHHERRTRKQQSNQLVTDFRTTFELSWLNGCNVTFKLCNMVYTTPNQHGGCWWYDV